MQLEVWIKQLEFIKYSVTKIGRLRCKSGKLKYNSLIGDPSRVA